MRERISAIGIGDRLVGDAFAGLDHLDGRTGKRGAARVNHLAHHLG